MPIRSACPRRRGARTPAGAQGAHRVVQQTEEYGENHRSTTIDRILLPNAASIIGPRLTKYSLNISSA